jgi:hypothetical protein
MASTRSRSRQQSHRLENGGSKRYWRASGFSTGCRRVVAIYRPRVQTTAISWGIGIPTVADMSARSNSTRWTLLILMDRPARFADCGRATGR